MHGTTRGMLAAFAATAVMSGLMWLAGATGLSAGLDLPRRLGALLAAGPATGWVLHAAFGTLVWGGLFVLHRSDLPGRTAVAKALGLSLAAWFLLMGAGMPLLGAGFFAARLGVGAVVLALVLHLAYGATLGLVEASLGRAGAAGRAGGSGASPRESAGRPGRGVGRSSRAAS
jgi:hypothetical protein